MRVYFCSLALLLFCFTNGISAETRIFDLSHRRAIDVADAVRAVLGDEAKVTAVDHSLVVSADPHQLSIVAELLRRIDHPQRMLRVFVAQDIEQTGDGTSIEAAGHVSIGSSTVVVGRPQDPSRGGTAVVTGHGDRLRIGANTFSHREIRNSEQFIVTLEGSPARVSIGNRIPVTERWLLLARRHAHVVESVRYETVDTGFEVQPELVGDLVQLSIRPFLAFQDPRLQQEIRFQELTTRVNVPLGQWLDLGGTMAGRDEVSREILGASKVRGEERGNIRVRIELQPD